MATDTIKPPPGFVLDKGQPRGITSEPTQTQRFGNLPPGFIIDKQTDLSPNQQLQLIQQLGGEMPLTAERSQQLLRGAQQTVGDLRAQRGGQAASTQRQNAFRQLEQSGVSREQIGQVLEIQRRVSPGLLGQIKQNIGEDVGGLAGGAAGAKLALSLGSLVPFPEEFVTVPLFAGAGAFLLGGAGKNIQQAISPLESPSARDFIRSGGRQALFESGGRLAAGIIRAPFVKKVSPSLDDIGEGVGKLFKDKGGFFTPKQRDPRIVIRATEELSRGSFGGGAVFEGFDVAQQGQAIEVAKEIIDRIAGGAVKDPDVLGRELFEMFVRKGEKGIIEKGLRQDLLTQFFTPLYKEVGRLSPGTKLSTLPIKQFMEKKLKQDLAQGGGLLTKAGRSDFRFALKNLKTQRTIGQMADLRSSYLKDARKFAVGADKSETVFKELAAVADAALFDPSTVKGMTPEAASLLRNINAVYGPGREIYNLEFVKSVISRLSSSPSKVLNTVYKDFDFDRLKNIRDLLTGIVPKTQGVGTTSKNISRELKVLRNTLKGVRGGDKVTQLLARNAAEGRAAWKQLNAAWYASKINEFFDPQTKLFNITGFNKAMRKIPDKTFKLMFPGVQSKNVKSTMALFNALSPAKKGFVSMFGKTFELGGITGAGAALSAGSGIGIAASGAIAISPTAFAKLATNPKATKALTLGFKKKSATVAIIPIAARLINLLNEDIRNDQLDILRDRRRNRQRERGERPFTGLSGFGGIGGGRF